MKNKKLFFTLPLVLALGATACGKGGGGGKKVGPWGAEIEALMKEALHGEVLPYVDAFADKEFEYELFDGQFYLDSEEATFTSADVEAYAATFEGWEDLSEDAGYPYFTKEVTVSGQTREIFATFALVDDEGYLAEEEPAFFTLIAGDPGAWPGDSAAAIIDYLSDEQSTAVLPEFEGATYFEVDTDWIILGMAAIYADCDLDAFEDYLEKFVEPEWVLDYDEENEQYFAISEDGLIQIDLYYSLYSDEESGYATIIFSVPSTPIEQLTEWPAEQIAELIQVLSPGSTAVLPALEGSDGYELYDNIESYNSIDIYVNGEEDDVEAYAALFVAPNWSCEYDTVYKRYLAVPADLSLQVGIKYSATYEQVYITIEEYVAPIVEWPAEGAAALVQVYAPESSTVLPAFEGASGYEVLTSSIWCTTADTDSPAAYATTLENAGWNVIGPDASGYRYAVSPAKDLLIRFSYNTSYGQMAIYFAAYAPGEAAFPAAAVAEFLTTYDLGFELSALSDPEGDGFTVTASENGGYHYLRISVLGDQVTAWNAVIAPIMEAAGYEAYSSSATAIAYSNEDEHEVQIQYSSGRTYITLWE